MPLLDNEEVELENFLWKATGELRWRRPKGGTDNDLILEILWERVTGERHWQPIPTLLED